MKSMVWRYYTHNFLRQLAFFSAVLVPFFTEWGHITLFQVQLLQSWFALWLFLLEVPTGAVADFLGRKYSLFFGGVVASIGAYVYGSVPSIYVFLLGEFLLACGMALTSGADEALLYDYLVSIKKEKDAKKIFAKAQVWTLIGVMVSAPIGSVIASRFGLQGPMMFTAIPFFLAGILSLTFHEVRSTKPVSEQTRYVDVVREGFSFFYRHKLLRRLAIDAIVVASAGYFVIWLYQPLLQRIHIPILYFGFGHMLLTGTEILISSQFTFMEKLVGSAKKYFRWTALLIAIPFLLVAIFPNLLTIGLFIMVSGGFGMTRLQLMAPYMHMHIASDKRATVISSISMFRRFTLAALNPIVGFIATLSLPAALIGVGLLPLAIFFFSPLTEEALGKGT